MKDQQIPWGKIEFSDNVFSQQISPEHSIDIERTATEIIITTHSTGESETRRFITGKTDEVFIEPGLPPLPILMKPIDLITILPSRKLEAYLEIPFSIRVLIGTVQKKVFLYEYEPIKISRCYIDTTEKGEFAFQMESRICSTISEYRNPCTSVYCPITILNRSAQYLTFGKMVYRTSNLSIYSDGRVLISSPVHFTFKGSEQLSQISYRKTPPNADRELRLITTTKQQDAESILKRSFFFLKTLYTG